MVSYSRYTYAQGRWDRYLYTYTLLHTERKWKIEEIKLYIGIGTGFYREEIR